MSGWKRTIQDGKNGGESVCIWRSSMELLVVVIHSNKSKQHSWHTKCTYVSRFVVVKTTSCARLIILFGSFVGSRDQKAKSIFNSRLLKTK